MTPSMLPPELDGFGLVAEHHVADLPHERLLPLLLLLLLLPVAARVELELAVELVSLQVGHYLVYKILVENKV